MSRKSNPICSEEPMSGKEPRNVDAMMAASQRWTEMLIELLDSHGIEKYQILYGVRDGEDIVWCDPSDCSTSRLDPSFGMRLDSCFPSDLDLSKEVARIFEESGLGEFLEYSGWEGGDCGSDDPNEWPKDFWDERYLGERLYTAGKSEDAAYGVRELKQKLLR